MRAKQFISEKAVSKKQQQFFGIVRAMQKGDMPKSGEAGEVAKDMKKSDVKDFAKTKHKGLPTKKKTKESKTIKVDHTAVMDSSNAGYVLVQDRKCIARGSKDEMLKLHEETPQSRVWVSTATVGQLVESLSFEDVFQGLNPKSEIYVDMDGVLADFFRRWQTITGKNWRDIKGDDLQPALQAIRDDDDFWLELPLTSNAKKLLGIIKQVKGSYKILSAPLAGDPKAEPHKREWVAKNLDFFPPTEVIITKDKAKYATNPDGTPNILIDDYGVNIDKWESAGGIGFKHKDHKFERTAKKLKAEIEENFQHGIRNYIEESWSKKYKDSINCSNPKGFSQKAHCAGRKKRTNEGDLGVTSGALRGTVIDLISDKIQQTNDVEKLKYWLKMIVGRTIKPRGENRYTITDEDVRQALNQVKENFADGKKKGKSRPGRVKRAGASCKGSVTSLRKKAKNASGERAKMYHWCANMKGGRKKGK